MPRTLIVTNDYPPRIGGIESFVSEVVAMLDHDVVVFTSSTPAAVRNEPGRAEPESAEPGRAESGGVEPGGVEVVRGGPVLLPTPATTREAIRLLRRSGASRVVFGAAAPLGLMAPALRAAGAQRIVALSHGHETWWAAVPGARTLLRRVGDAVDHVSTISDYTAARIAVALSPFARQQMIRLSPPVDPAAFSPAPLSRRGAERPRVVSVARLVRQKGIDTLLAAWRLVLDSWPPTTEEPELVVVGTGPQRARLLRLASSLGLGDTVRWAGPMPRSAVVDQLQRADVFALPMRTRLAGLNPEGLGLAALEAAACALPVVVGDSGGAPETVQAGRTGFVVGSDPRELASRLLTLLTNRDLARQLGAAGRRYVVDRFGVERARHTLRSALALEDDHPDPVR